MAEEDAVTIRKQRRRERKLSETDKREYCDFNDLMPEEDNGTEDTTEASEEEKFLADKWQLTSLVLIRIHNTPRKRLFTPNEDQKDPCPMPVAFFDIQRRTDTSNSSISESNIDD